MAKKDFGRRLMPEYLLKYAEELNKNHPDPSASWGGGSGGDYTAGEGIDITGDVISIDEEVVAKKTDIPTVPNVLSAFTNDVGYITGITRTDVTTALGYVPGTSNFSGDYEDLSGKPTIPDSTSDLVNDSGFISGVTSNMITTALGYTPGTSNFSGSYNDLTDKPTIPTVPTRAEAPFLGVGQASDGLVSFSLTGASGTYHKNVEAQSDIRVNLQALNPNFGSGLTASYNSSTNALDVSIDTTTVALKSDIPTVPTKTSDLQNDSGFITGVSWADVTGKPTFATVATSGSYNDLSDKPTIPDTTNFVTTNTNQTILGTKTFTDSIILADRLESGHNLVISNDIGLIGFYYNGRYFELPISKPASSVSGEPYTLATTDDIPSLSGYATETWVGQQGFLTGITSAMISTALGYTPGTSNFSGSYTDLTDKPSIPSTASSTSTSTVTPTTETLVFTLDDDSTVTVNVMTGATVSTTTTTTLS